MSMYSICHTAGDRTPYTYCITHLPSGKHYYGVKWSKGCHPSTFWIDYKSSSQIVKELLERDGPEAFSFEIRKVFNDPKKAVEWESNVLKRLNIPNNPKWLNKNVRGKSFCVESMAETTKAKISATKKGRPGTPLSEETRAKISATKKGKTRKPFSAEHKAKIAASMCRYHQSTSP